MCRVLPFPSFQCCMGASREGGVVPNHVVEFYFRVDKADISERSFNWGHENCKEIPQTYGSLSPSLFSSVGRASDSQIF